MATHLPLIVDREAEPDFIRYDDDGGAIHVSQDVYDALLKETAESYVHAARHVGRIGPVTRRVYDAVAAAELGPFSIAPD